MASFKNISGFCDKNHSFFVILNTEQTARLDKNRVHKGELMKNYLNSLTQKSTQTDTETSTLDQSSALMAADDVHRIALRNPALFQTKSVPRLSSLSMGETGSGGMA